MYKTRLILVASLILVSCAAFAGKGDDKKDEKGLEHRVTALEESREIEFLLRWDGAAGSPDCGLFYHFESPDWDAPEYISQGKDTFPPSFSGDYSGNLTAIAIRYPISIPPATSPTDIVAIIRGDLSVSTDGAALRTSQAAADLGYGAVFIVNHRADLSPFFHVNTKTITRLSSPDGITPFPIPTMMINWNDAFFHLTHALDEGPVPIFIEGTTFCSTLNASSFLTR